MSLIIPCKKFTHWYIIKQNLEMNLEKKFYPKPTLLDLETFYISIIKVPCKECPYNFS